MALNSIDFNNYFIRIKKNLFFFVYLILCSNLFKNW